MDDNKELQNIKTDSSMEGSTADYLLEALEECGVTYLFSNLGSDHPAIIEAIAKAKESGKQLPEIIVSPHESVALAAAHGYWLETGEPQAVFVHVDVGTQNLGGSLHNAFRSRVPVFIFAGDTPYTMEGELKGSRNRYINVLQDVYDQRGIVRPYVKWEYEIRTGTNIKQIIFRAIQVANSDPKGPVYLMGAREVLEESVIDDNKNSKKYETISPTGLQQSQVKEIVESLNRAKHPLIVTSYLGRNKQAVQELISFCETLAIPVIEGNPSFLNFPSNHSLHLGYNDIDLVSKSDVILVLDHDVPWMPTVNEPRDDATIYYIDVDPIKEDIPLWHIPASEFIKCDSFTALKQLNEHLQTTEIDLNLKSKRYDHFSNIHDNQRKEWKKLATEKTEEYITPAYLSGCLNEIMDEDTVLVNEAITNSTVVSQQISRVKPGTYFSNGGSSLGWYGGVATGIKLASPEKTVVSLTGDGTFYLNSPSSVYWMSQQYNVPFLTIIYNNHGWNATKQNVLRIHPDGFAKKNDNYWVSLKSEINLADVAKAVGNAYTAIVKERTELKKVLQKGLNEVRNGRSAVIDVHLEPISNQSYNKD